MSAFQYANNPQTTLSGAIAAGAGSITVASGAAFPTRGRFSIIIDSEILHVTSISGVTWTVQRGKEGTSAAAHNSNAAVTGILTRDSFLSARGIDARSYGVVGDGVADDTVALQAAIDALLTTGAPGLYIPAGSYKITAALVIPVISGKFILGAGIDQTTITQFTDNIPIFKTTEELIYSVRFGDMSLQYNNTQTSANTGAIAINFRTTAAGVGSGWFYWKVNRLVIRKAHIAIGIGGPGATGSLAVWNCSFEQIRTENISQSILFLSSPTSIGMPICTFKNLTHLVNTVAPAGPAIAISGMEVNFDGLDIEDWTGQLFSMSGGSPVKITGLHTERWTANTATALFYIANAPLTIENAAIYFEVTGGVAATLFGLDVNGSVRVTGSVISATLTSGTITGLTGGSGGNYDFAVNSTTNVTLPTPPTSAIATASGALTLGTAQADVPGATITATAAATEIWLVTAFYDILWSVASGGNFAFGDLDLDGVSQSGAAVLTGDTVLGGTVGFVWRLSVSAGAHTVKLRGHKLSAGGTATIRAGTTCLMLQRQQS